MGQISVGVDIFASLQVLIVAPAFGQLGQAVQLMKEMSACTRGYSAAHVVESANPFSELAVAEAVVMAQGICKDDDLVVGVFHSLKDGPDEKTLEEAETFVQQSIERQIRHNVEALRPLRESISPKG